MVLHFIQTAGKSLSVMTTVDPEKKPGGYSPSEYLNYICFQGRSQDNFVKHIL